MANKMVAAKERLTSRQFLPPITLSAEKTTFDPKPPKLQKRPKHSKTTSEYVVNVWTNKKIWQSVTRKADDIVGFSGIADVLRVEESDPHLAMLSMPQYPIVASSTTALKMKSEQARQTPPLITKRLRALVLEASEEGIDISSKSKAALCEFCRRLRDLRIPSIFLLPNGNFRALWRAENGTQIGIQFREDDLAQYVILKGQEPKKQSLGVEEVDAIANIVSALKLDYLWQERSDLERRILSA